jgi:aerobic-type carbon monoxide dehydrogenase small subunit (CoxS/CutS family)
VAADRASNRVAQGVTRAEPFTFTLDSQPIEAFPGETIAAALLAAGIRTLRRTANAGAPRGIFCGMGICFDCLVVVDGRPHLRACLIEAKPGMQVLIQDEADWRAGRA